MAMTQKKVIQKFMKSLDKTNLSGVSALDAAIRACSNFGSAQEVINNMIEDCRISSSADSFLKNYCGIKLSNSDTGAITGKDAGGSKVKTNKSIVPEDGSWKTFTGNSFTRNGVTFNLVDYNSQQSISYSSLNSVQKRIWNGLYTWWAKNALDLNSSSYGSNFSFTSKSSATTNAINFGFINEDSGALAVTTTWYTYTDPSYTVQLGMAVNTDYYSNLSSSDKNGYDSVSKQTYLDRVLAHEFTHAVMSANINNFVYLPSIIKEGMAEVTHGIDDQRGNIITYLANNAVKLKQSLQLGSSYEEVSGVPTANYAGGYMFLRYLAKQAASSSKSGKNIYNTTSYKNIKGSSRNDTIYGANNFGVTVSGGSGNDLISGTFSSSKIDGGSGNDRISLSGGNYGNTLHGGTGNDKIYGGSGDDKLYGDSGNDLLFGGAGNDTLKGGKGKDVFLCADGDGWDIITDYQNNIDEVHINSGAVQKAYWADGGKSVDFYFENGGFTVKNAKGKYVVVKNADGTTTNWDCRMAAKTISSQTVQDSDKNITDIFWPTDKIEFIRDDNIESITENGFSETTDYKLENQNFDTLNTKTSAITYATK